MVDEKTFKPMIAFNTVRHIPPTEWYERNNGRGSWYGYTEDFAKYPNVMIHIDPFSTRSHELKGWRLNFKQKTKDSRLYLHFHNKKNFGFRVRLPKGYYNSIEDMFNKMIDCGGDYLSSEMSVENLSKPKETIVEKVIIVNNTFEDALQAERERIFDVIGDFRGTKIELPDNVVDFSAYLKEPKPLEEAENDFNELISAFG